MRVQIAGGPADTVVIDATAGTVSSVNGQTGGVTITAAELGADPAGTAAAVQIVALQASADAQTAAEATAALDATAKVDAHTIATDPHGDRAYADSQFLSKANGTLTGVLEIKNGDTAPATNPTDGVIMYAQGGVLKTRAASGDIFDTTKRTVTGAKGGNAALASLLTQLAAAGLITDSTT